MGIHFGSILQFYWIPNSMTRSDLIAISIPLLYVYIVHLNMVHVLFSCMYFFFSLNWLILLNFPMLAIWHAQFSSHDVLSTLEELRCLHYVNLQSYRFKTITNQSILIGFCIIHWELGLDFCMIL